MQRLSQGCHRAGAGSGHPRSWASKGWCALYPLSAHCAGAVIPPLKAGRGLQALSSRRKVTVLEEGGKTPKLARLLIG